MGYSSDDDTGESGTGGGETSGRGSGPGSAGQGGSGPGVGAPGPRASEQDHESAPPRELTEKQKKIQGYKDRLAGSPFDPHSSEGLEIWRTDPEYYNWVREQQEGKINEDLHGTGRMGGQSKSPYRGDKGEDKGGSEIGGMFGGSGGGGEGEGTAGTKVRDVPSDGSGGGSDSINIKDLININLSGPRALKSRIRITSKVSKNSDISDFSLGNKSIASSFMENLEINKFDFNIGSDNKVDMNSIGNVGFGRYFNKGV